MRQKFTKNSTISAIPTFSFVGNFPVIPQTLVSQGAVGKKWIFRCVCGPFLLTIAQFSRISS